jgi:hypothetical protein
MTKRRLFVLAILALLAATFGSPTTSHAGGYCYGAPYPRLNVGQVARVTPGLPNALRNLPGVYSYSYVIGWIPGGASFSVVGGPRCMDGYEWWLVNYAGIVGWTPEGQGGTYWLEPIEVSYGCPGNLPARLNIGRQGQITPGLANVIRNVPNRDYGSYIIGRIPPGGTFAVLDGPRCGSGYTWWLVSYGGMIGWTAESGGYAYWTQPL